MSKNWMVIDSVKQEMRCERCGKVEPVSQIDGKLVDTAISFMKAFIKAHKGCEEGKNG